MRRPKETPARVTGETAIYEDDPFELGEMDESRFVIVKDFLPPPEKLVFKNPRRKITITLEQESIDFFKQESKRLGVPYQRMIRNLLHEYVDSHRQSKTPVTIG